MRKSAATMDAVRIAANLHLNVRNDSGEAIVTPGIEVPRRDECRSDCGQPSPERPKRRRGIAFEAAEGGTTDVTKSAEPEPTPSGQEATNAELMVTQKEGTRRALPLRHRGGL